MLIARFITVQYYILPPVLTPHAPEVTNHQVPTGMQDRVAKFTEFSVLCINLCGMAGHFRRCRGLRV